MADFSTYGVTSADFSKYVGPFNADATTAPTADQCGELVEAAGAEWHNFLLSVGVDPASITADTDLATYTIGREWITRKAAGEANASRMGVRTELSILQMERTDRVLRRLEERVARMGDGAPVGKNAANAMHTSVERAAEMKAATSTRGLGARLAESGGI